MSLSNERRTIDRAGVRWLRRLSLLLTLGVAVPSAVADWVRTYEWAGQLDISSVAASLHDARRLYAVPGGTRWLLASDDGGFTWQRTASVATSAVIGYVAVDPMNSDVIYVGTSGDAFGMYTSIDGGQSFTPLGDGQFKNVFALGALVVDPQDRATLYASRGASCGTTCTGGGVLKSTDTGRTWVETGRVGTNMQGLAIDQNEPAVVYATGIDLTTSPRTGGLYCTTDAGATWPALFPGLTVVRYVATDARSRVYLVTAAARETPLLRSSNQGTVFERLAVDPRFALSGVTSDPRRPEFLYASVAGPAPEAGSPATTPGALVSFDDGATWQPLGTLAGEFVSNVVVAADGTILAAAKSGIYRYVQPFPRRRAVSKQ